MFVKRLLFIMLINKILCEHISQTEVKISIREIDTELKKNRSYTRHISLLTRNGFSRVLSDSAIFFPDQVSSHEVTEGDSCYTYRGQTGKCILLSNCNSLFQSGYGSSFYESQLILKCGIHRDSQFICCPEPKVKNQELINESINKVVKRPILNLRPETSYESSGEDKNNEDQINIKNPTNMQNEPVSNLEPNKPNKEKLEEAHPYKIRPKTDNWAPIKGLSDLTYEETQQICGFYKQDQGQGREIWPWTVSIGNRLTSGSIEWTCLGSLITTEYILTTASCTDRIPDVIGISNAFIGVMSNEEMRAVSLETLSIAQVIPHEKYTRSKVYKNIALIQIERPIVVTSATIPVCYPFLAGVLDILTFKGTTGKTIGFKYPTSYKKEFSEVEYKIINSTRCSNLFKTNRLSGKRYPSGIRSDQMCGVRLSKSQPTPCQAPGAPFVIFDDASRTFVQIGISTGDPSCREFNRQLVSFTRMNSYSNWIRSRVGELPNPPPCFV